MKTYILKFNKILGDYCIVEEENDVAEQNVKNKESEKNNKKFSFFSNFFAKNDKNLQSKQQTYLRLGDRSIVQNNDTQNKIDSPNNMQNNSNNTNNSNETNRPNTSVEPIVNNNMNNNNTNNTNNNSNNTNNNNNSNNNPSTINEGISLLIQIYQKTRILNMIYQNLRSISNSDMYNQMIAENTSLIGGILNIINEISSNENNFESLPMPQLSSNGDEIISLAKSVIDEIRQINNRLLKLFNVENINRVLNLIETTLSAQNDRLTNIQIEKLSLEKFKK